MIACGALPHRSMSTNIPYVSFDMRDKDRKHGQSWADVGQRMGTAIMNYHDREVLEWLETNLHGRWRFSIFVVHMPTTALSDPTKPTVKLGIELQFDHVGDAVMFKLIWGGTERF